MDELILIDKPSGMTSFGVVARIRRVLSRQAGHKVKVGHTGTLDPFATGLMILLTGKKCREASSFTKLDKWYEAEIILGQTSTTGDPEGEITRTSGYRPTEEEINHGLKSFIGDIQQQPPVFSAIKIDGKRAYKLARKGVEIDMPLRTVTVFTIELVFYSYPTLKIRTHVSSGTYIRSLAIDIGAMLGTGAYCKELRRIQIADYNIQDAQTLADFGIES